MACLAPGVTAIAGPRDRRAGPGRARPPAQRRLGLGSRHPPPTRHDPTKLTAGDEAMERAALRIYLGYAAGVGKTTAMLAEGRRQRQLGVDIVVGLVEPHGRAPVLQRLEARGYQVQVAANGRSALMLAARTLPDVVVLDLGLPDVSGVEVIAGLRGWTQVPIIILSVREQEADKITALDAGADDYVTKPFSMGELLARVRAASRRVPPAKQPTVIRTADFTVDLAAKRVTGGDGGQVRLTPTEWHLVELLVTNPRRLVSQRQLLREVWGPTSQDHTDYLRVYMAQIRRKLEPEPARPRYFVTEPGMGYRFEFEQAPPP
jgi:two-component system KDP operon response regulator KdpE